MLNESKGKPPFMSRYPKRFICFSVSNRSPLHSDSCKDYYEVLNVTKEATDTEIKKSYKKIALVLHPGTFRRRPQFIDIT